MIFSIDSHNLTDLAERNYKHRYVLIFVGLREVDGVRINEYMKLLQEKMASEVILLPKPGEDDVQRLFNTLNANQELKRRTNNEAASLP